MIRTIKWLSVVSSIGMVFILLGGALVTKTGSEDGCGNSWPLCHGQLFPTDVSPELLIEYSHRLVSTVIGATILLLVVLAWIYLSHNREVKFLSAASLFFIIVQGLIGSGCRRMGPIRLCACTALRHFAHFVRHCLFADAPYL